ncbi:unnamed protein product, partial [Brachionus calyciflorus]
MKFASRIKICGKIIGLILCLYIFICSLELMSSAFRLLGGRLIGKTNQLNVILDNQLAGLMLGILLTILVQSSSTSTSIVVSMVSAQIISVKSAIPIIMGSNIGTSITSTLVSFSHMNDDNNFERAFAGAVVHDIFNFLSVMVLLPIEIIFNYLEKVTQLLVKPLYNLNNSDLEIELLNKLTKPLVNSIIQLNNSVIENLASGIELNPNETLIKHWCKYNEKAKNSPLVKCKFLFESINLPEWAIGLILLFTSLLILCICLICLVKILNSLFFGKMADLVKKIINSNCPGFLKYLTGFFAIIIGALLTLIIQSSSVFTSTLTPLVGIGVVSIERVFPLILGSNIGTTITGILAALSSKSSSLKYSLQIALCHLFFNLTGILIWYPLPCLRRIPIRISKWLGRITFKYKWFSIFYILVVFFVIPIFFLLLSYAGMVVLLCFLIPLMFLVIMTSALNFMQKKFSYCLPAKMRDWKFLPEFLRSLEPYDKFMKMIFFCLKDTKNTENG